jgi:predicted glutamine amidotransferase
MCMIAFKPKNVEFKNWKPLLYGYAKNKDGVGISYLKSGDDCIRTNKTFKTFRDFWKFYKQTIKKEDIAVIHFRYATHGVKDNGNRHPFPVTTDRDFIRKEEFVSEDIIAHNGVFSFMSKHCTKDSIFSDSQEFIIRWFAPLVDMFKSNQAAMEILGHAISSNRLIYMNKDGIVRLWGDWNEKDGIHYSNDNHSARPFKASKTFKNKGYTGFIQYGKGSWYKHASYGESTYDEEYKYTLDPITNTYVMKQAKALPSPKKNAKKVTASRKCEHCKGTEGKDIVLKKYGAALLCENCINVLVSTEQVLFDVCCKCGKSEMEAEIYPHLDSKNYCLECLPEVDGVSVEHTNHSGKHCTECGDTIGMDEISFNIGIETICAQCYKNFVGIY